MKKQDDFDLVNLPEAAQDPEIKAEDFTLQQADSKIHEQKFQTKPTTFLKDSLRRFSKNKSSVVAAYILGVLVLLAVFVPIFNTSNVSESADSALINLEPKLFDSGTGFWDGTKNIKHEPIDAETFLPNPTTYLEGGIYDLNKEGLQYTNDTNIYGKEGYLQFGFYGGLGINEAYLSSTQMTQTISPATSRFILDLTSSNLTIEKFSTVDLAKMVALEGDSVNSKQVVLPENVELGLVSLEFCYSEGVDDYTITLVEPSVVHNVGLDPLKFTDTDKININEKIAAATTKTSFDNFYFRLKIVKDAGQGEAVHVCSLVQSLIISTDSTNEAEKSYFSMNENEDTGVSGISFNDAMKMMCRTSIVGTGANAVTNLGYWKPSDSSNKVMRNIYLGKALFASFKYDSYLATLGRRNISVSSSRLKAYKKNGWIDFDIRVKVVGGIPQIDADRWNTFKEKHDGQGVVILNKDKCPVLEPFELEDIYITGYAAGEYFYSVDTDVTFYKYIGLSSMPKYLFGTDKTGRDMFKYVFEGLRNSLALGVLTFVVCFLFGLLWGSVSGYFGGAVDLVMERVTDILSGVPWIVVMTLVILKSGRSDFGTFALALCLTGWIGTASTTRTQFYRFRGREYVLASRTLGASDGRLIAKHILPNAMGTIITGAVLMIPSVIFSEATISYLGLGFKNLSSLGVILSTNQNELTNHPYQLLFPSAVIALVMISFNLFGNGLRDAINPSLKGEDE